MAEIDFDKETIKQLSKWYQEYKEIAKETGREPKSMDEWIYDIVKSYAKDQFFGDFTPYWSD